MFYGWLCQRNAQQVLLISTKDEWRSFGCLFLQAALSCQDDPEQHQMRRQWRQRQMAIKGKDKDKAEECFDDNNLVGCLFWQGASSGLSQQEKVFCPRLCILSQPFKIATWNILRQNSSLPWKIIQFLSSRLLASVSQKWKKQRLYFGTFAKQKRNRMFQRNVTEIPSDISNVFKTLARAIFKLVVILKCWQALSVQLPISSLALFFFSLVMVTIVMSSCKWASDSPFSEFQSISKSGNTSDTDKSDTSVQVIHVIQMIQVMQVMLVMQVSQVMQVSLAHLWVDFWVIFCLQIMIIAENT